MAQIPIMVNTHPLPIAEIHGSATIAPKQEKMFRTKLLTATPEDARLGINSVSIVVAKPKISMLPMPKKKLAKSCGWLLAHGQQGSRKFHKIGNCVFQL